MVHPETLEAARTGFAVGPVLAPAVLEVTGNDARDYLHRMSTQDLSALRPGGAVYTAFLNAKGRLFGEGHVLRQAQDERAEEGRLFVVVDRDAGPELAAHLEQFVIMDDVVIADRSDAYRIVPVFGAKAAIPLADRAEGGRGAAGAADAGDWRLALPNARRGATCTDLLVPEPDAERIRAEILSAGATGLDAEALEALRILGGVARWGRELDGARLPMEAGLTGAAISFSKGCYIGQEIVVRATARGQLQRGLVQLALPPGAEPGTKLVAGGAEVGVVTSAAETPEGRVGLGYLRRAHWAVGTRVTAGEGDAVVRKALAENAETCAPPSP
jgi:tRNA-modifying protein YgfZ